MSTGRSNVSTQIIMAKKIGRVHPTIEGDDDLFDKSCYEAD